MKLIYLLPLFLIALLSACSSSNNPLPAPAVPQGNFTGQFRLLIKHANKPNYDTVKANIQLSMQTATGYKVTGDTSSVHAGSYGTYSISSNAILFTDKTYSAAAAVTKTHLNGLYQFFYDGAVLQMRADGALDTLSLQYDLKKVN